LGLLSAFHSFTGLVFPAWKVIPIYLDGICCIEKALGEQYE